jgi:exopolyphosphatase/guanosine-5'-triphosphate,3'-diphosphate pyrophosphatase
MPSETTEKQLTSAGQGAVAARPVAVIDIGTTSIRMAIAQISETGEVTTLDSLAHAVNLGRDAFTRGTISRSTIEDCVRVLKNYRQVLREYQIEGADQIRVVATTAVREALNRLAFLDRVYIATGLRVDPIDEAEVNRLTFMGIHELVEADPVLSAGRTLVTEVGGGNTEMLLLRGARVVASHSYRLGSYRLRKMLEKHRAPGSDVRRVMVRHIRRTVVQVQRDVPRGDAVEILALGGDVRFAAAQLLPQWDPAQIGSLPLDGLERLTRDLLDRSVDELVRRHQLAYPAAETVGLALLAYVELARAYELDHLRIASTSLRDGLLREMAARGAWTESFKSQIVQSAIELGRKFNFDEAHACHIAELSKVLFMALRQEHGLEPRYELLLYIAALLHDIGYIVSPRSHHKHALYLIQNSELFGLGGQELLLVGLVARYHRRATPKLTHDTYANLDPERRIIVSKLAAILRIADALDRSGSQRIRDIECSFDDGRLVISVPSVDDLSLEQLALVDKGTLFQDVYGMQVQLRKA